MFQPTYEEFKQLSLQGNLIPVCREILADFETPVSAYLKLAHGDYGFLLESVEGGEMIGRYSFLGSQPFMVLRSKGNRVTLEKNGETTERILRSGEDALDVLKELLASYSFVPIPGLPRFCGGAVGYLSYDMVRHFEKLPVLTDDDLELPDSCFLFADSLLIFDHIAHRIKVLCNAEVKGDPKKAYDKALDKIESLIGQLKEPITDNKWLNPEHHAIPPLVSSNLTRQKFEEMVHRVKKYVFAGDCIQTVLSQRFQTDITTDSFNIYRALRSINPSPYMFYLSFGDVRLVSSSPEILVTELDGKVTTRPLAGTRRRGLNPAEDTALMEELLKDPKECAEHVMLVDLGRNDIGRVCETGTVKVAELMNIEKYSHVMHIYSHVEGNLSKKHDNFDLLRASFPAGTVSGAPKIRAMEIIEELEPTRRGPYAGAAGYFSFSGNMDAAITIRTIVCKGNKAFVQAGAGIVADSVPEQEYQETLNKAQALLKAIEWAEMGLE